MVPKTLHDEMEFIRTTLNIMHMGTPVATRKHAKYIPEQALALSTESVRNYFPQVDLELNDALKYLRKDTLDISGDNKGYALVSFENIPLGWINLLGNRSNNMYPTTWRIRMNIP
jgi:NOL1/NOP2/fmu family ribosome biogenesis protein